MPNRKTVAVVGINGAVGKSLLTVLSEKADYFASPIRAITRDISKASKQPTGVELYQATFDNDQSLKRALNSVDVVFDLTASGISSAPLIDAAVEAGVKTYFPSEFDSAYSNSKYPNPYRVKLETAKYARSKGLKTIQVQTGMFAEWNFIYPVFNGIDPTNNIYKKIGSGDKKIASTFITDLSHSLVELALLDRSIPDEIFIQSEAVTDTYVVELWEKYNNVQLTVQPIPIDQVEKDAQEANRKFIKDSAEDYEKFIPIVRAEIAEGVLDHSNSGHRELINPNESKFKWTKLSDHAEDLMTGKIPAPF